MRYSVDDEYKIFEEEPELRKFRERVIAKPNGPALYDNYIQLRVMLKNDHDIVECMDPNSSYYGQVKDIYDKRFRKLQEMEQDLDLPQTYLQKFVNAKSIITTDPLEKAIDVMKGFFSGPKQEPDVREESDKPSLWNIFWK